LTLPEDWTTRSEKRTPQAKLVLRPPPQPYGPKKLLAELSFDYGGVQTPEGHPGSRIYQSDKRLLWERDLAFESECAQKLDTLGFPWKTDWNQSSRSGHPSRLSETVLSLTQLGWRVDAEGKIYRSGGTLQGGIRSDRDWFDLELSADFDGVQADVSSLLAALRKNEKFVRLGDGTFGILPEEWLSKYGLAARMGSPVKDALRFTAGQAGLLDALLSEKPEIRLDAAFQKAREKLTRFSKVEPTDPARTFHGTLRPYQREGLGWLNYLRDFGFGGCLADDMGLGKTVQVLAFLESHHAHRSKPGPGKRNPPSLAIVPKSLIFNWKEEVSRFTPSLRLLDHTGIQRFPPGNHFNDYDLILTTYGTLRRDAFYFKDFVFDYVVLDEAHTIKNPQSANAKAARLLKASHRLAMTGTPVQNRLGEIWSLFDFLNPGMLGASHALESASKNDGKPEDHAVLARALKPFLLRRTKEAVAKDLPKKTEQVLLCEMRGAQKSLYEGLRSHYRDSLLKRVDRQGLGKSKMHVLEALLRLRQAACHPGLIDHTKSGETASKLDVLLPSLEEVREGGHKAIVFSQFTSFLSIVQDHLAPLKMPYAYLDGATRDREEQVRRFQNDKDCSLFLISLKAGGLGLNLTEAEYVYLLDPWWNPAVEAQAIDRAHRIGQTKRVSAYRLISQGTVEEKIVAMQKEKKKMAEAVLNPEGGLLGNLTREDLEMLLS
jgi:SNF2 family DNA or RNA helicase